MNIFEIGKPFDPIVGKPESVYFDADDAEYFLIYNFNNPTEKEIAAVQQENPFEIRYAVVGDIIWILSKVGNLAWTDAPYVPQLSKNATFVHPEEGEGTPMFLLLTDSQTGIIKAIRFIGLGTDFSRSLLSEIEFVGAKPFDPATHYDKVNQIMQRYTTRDLLKFSVKRWVIK